ncbi:hypothetical protein [Bradyrhizobium sp. USDA 4354]
MDGRASDLSRQLAPRALQMRAGSLRDQGPRVRTRKTTGTKTADTRTTDPRGNALGAVYPRVRTPQAPDRSRALCDKDHALPPRPRRADPRSGHLKDIETSNHEVHALARAYLERHRKDMRKLDPALAAFMCVSTIEAIAHNTVLKRESYARRFLISRIWPDDDRSPCAQS